MKAYKGFNKDMTCRWFKYEEGKTYHEERAEMCVIGFHACLNPIDCFRYYPPSESVYHEVDIDDLCSGENEDDSKVCGKTITIGREISLTEINRISIALGGDCASLSGGNRASLSGGDNASLSGGDNASLSGGNYASLSGGDCASLSGGDCASLSGGNYASLSGGNYASLSGGDNASLSGGNRASLSGGEKSVLSSRGGKARGGSGAMIALAEVDIYGNIASFAAGVVGMGLKADTWYICKNGELVECDE